MLQSAAWLILTGMSYHCTDRVFMSQPCSISQLTSNKIPLRSLYLFILVNSPDVFLGVVNILMEYCTCIMIFDSKDIEYVLSNVVGHPDLEIEDILGIDFTVP